MNGIEVYGVELKPYKTSDGTMLLSSNIIGNSLEAREKPTYPSRRNGAWTEEEFLARVREKDRDKGAATAERLISLCPSLGLRGMYGRGEKLANFMAKKDNLTVFQIVQAGSKFHLSLSYSDLIRLDGCKEWTNEKLRDEILGIFPSETDTKDMVKESAIWVPLQSLNVPGSVEKFGELMRSLL